MCNYSEFTEGCNYGLCAHKLTVLTAGVDDDIIALLHPGATHTRFLSPLTTLSTNVQTLELAYTVSSQSKQ